MSLFDPAVQYCIMCFEKALKVTAAAEWAEKCKKGKEEEEGDQEGILATT